MKDYTIIFGVAGKRNENDKVWLTSHARKKPLQVYHRNDYHTVIRIKKSVLSQYFSYDRQSGIYRNTASITWAQLAKIADITVYCTK